MCMYTYNRIIVMAYLRSCGLLYSMIFLQATVKIHHDFTTNISTQKLNHHDTGNLFKALKGVKTYHESILCT